MTADFLTDLDVIGHLDWTPGCEMEDCDDLAGWMVEAHMVWREVPPRPHHHRPHRPPAR